MRLNHHTTWLILLLAWPATLATTALATPGNNILVAPENPKTTFSWCTFMLDCLVPGIQKQVIAQPSHGALTWTPGGLLQYEPHDAFWMLGTDSFTYRVTRPGEPAVVASVTLQAGHYGKFRRIEEAFESGDVEGLSGDAVVTPAAAIAGTQGLRVTAGTGAEAAVFTFENDGNDPGDQCPDWDDTGCRTGGDGAQGGNDTLKIRPPALPRGVGGTGTPSEVGTGTMRIYALERSAGDIAAEVLLISTPDGNDIVSRVFHRGGVATTDPFLLTEVENELRIEWWNSFEEERAGGLKLWVNGNIVGTITGLSEWHVGYGRRRVGVIPNPNSIELASFDIDDLRLTSSDRSSPAFQPVLRDNFEHGLAAWDTSSATFLKVVETAALVGDKGLEIRPVFGVDNFLFDPSPAASKQFGVRFRLDSGSLSMPGNVLHLLALSNSNQPESNQDQVRLVLREVAGNLWVSSWIRTGPSGGAWRVSPEIELSRQTSTIEFQWRASDEGGANGQARLWVDGVLGDSAGSLDNSAAVIESLRLGAWDAALNAQGKLHVDAFESWSRVFAE